MEELVIDPVAGLQSPLRLPPTALSPLNRRLAREPYDPTRPALATSFVITQTRTDEFVPIIVHVRLPDRGIHEVDVADKQLLLVQDFKQFLYNNAIVRTPPALMKLIYNRRALRDHECLRDVSFRSGDNVDVVIKVTAMTSAISLSFDEFIESVYPPHNSQNVSVNVEIRLVLRKNSSGHVLYLPSIQTHSVLTTLSNIYFSTDAQTENSVQKRWTEQEFNHRILLLPIEASQKRKLEGLRFKGSEQLPHKDVQQLHSWQAYTKQLPVACELRMSSMEEPLPHHIVLIPRLPLTPNTCYAILLCNHIPTVPVLEASQLDFLADGVHDDKLFLFTTAA